MFQIVHNGFFATLLPTPDADLYEELVDNFTWVNPLDLNDAIYFYQDSDMYGGIADKLAAYLVERGYECVILPPEHCKEYNWKFHWTYRPRQWEAVSSLLNEHRGIIKATPGAGKTAMIASIVANLGVKALVVCQNSKPFGQIYDTFVKSTDIVPGRFGDGYKEEGDVVIAMVQSIGSALQQGYDHPLREFIRQAKVVIVDECHHGVADTYHSLMPHLGQLERLYGVSATPHRDDDRHAQLEAVYGPIRYEITYGESIEDNVSCPITVMVEDVPPRKYADLSLPVEHVIDKETGIVTMRAKFVQPWRLQQMKRTRYAHIYQDYIVNNVDRNTLAVRTARDAMAQGKSCAVIVGRLDHAENVKALLPEAVIITSKTKKADKATIFEKLGRKEIMCVITTLMDEAVDVPTLSLVLLLAGGKSTVKLIQRLRSTRAFEGETALGYFKKTMAYAYYPIDNCDYLHGHSLSCNRLLKSVVAQSPQNRYIKLK